MTLFPQHRSFLVQHTATHEHRAPAPLSRDALERWLKGLSGASLVGEETGIRIEWSGPHQPLVEAAQLDTIRVNFEALCLLLRVACPRPIDDNGDPSGDAPCYHAYRATRHLRSTDEEAKAPTQEGLFEKAPDLEGLPLVFGDTETTGFAHEDRVIQLALVRVDPLGEVKEFTSYFNPEGRKNNGWNVNQISDWKTKTAPLFRSKVQEFVPLLKGAVFVAHNAGFDTRMMGAELGRCGLSWPCAAVIDTQKIAKALWPNAPKHKLDILALHLGLKSGRAHDARGDVQTLMALWHRIRMERPHFTVTQWARMAA